MMNSGKSKKLAEILEAENLRLFEPLTINFKPKNAAEYNDEILEIFNKALEGKSLSYPFKINFPIVHDKFVIVLDEEISFNRYRRKTLKSTIYNKQTMVNTGQYQRYCRTYEQNCLKVGLQQEIWSNERSELLFGKPSAPGDFFANGAPGWKLIAFQNFLQDVYALNNRWNYHRISIYDNLLVEGKLQSLGKLLQTGQENYHKTIFNNLNARLKILDQ